MSEETFEEINLNQNNCIKNFEISNSKEIEIKFNDPNKQTQFYHEFMNSNKDFFEKIGFKDISDDPIFNLVEEVEQIKSNKCEICKKEISRYFSKDKYCKFCGYTLCDKCSVMKRNIPKSKEDKQSIICNICENKYINYELHEKFKDKLSRKEIEIHEYNQRLEKFCLIHSTQLDEINKLNESILRLKRENKNKEEVITSEIHNLKFRTEEITNQSEKLSNKISESIYELKTYDEKRHSKEDKFQSVQKDRMDISNEYEKRSEYLEKILSKINHVSISIKNQEQNKLENIKLSRRETGNKHLDLLLREKMKSQRKELSNIQDNETTIIINPSKIIKEVYKEPLLNEKDHKENRIKKFIMYLGSKIFINN